MGLKTASCSLLVDWAEHATPVCARSELRNAEQEESGGGDRKSRETTRNDDRMEFITFGVINGIYNIREVPTTITTYPEIIQLKSATIINYLRIRDCTS